MGAVVAGRPTSIFGLAPWLLTIKAGKVRTAANALSRVPNTRLCGDLLVHRISVPSSQIRRLIRV